MRKHRKYVRAKHKKVFSQRFLLYTLIVCMMLVTVWIRNHHKSVLGLSVGSSDGTSIDTGGERVPDQGSGQVSVAPTVPAQPTTVIIPSVEPTQIIQNPLPTPSLIVPTEPVYVEIIDQPGSGSGGGTVDIGADPVTVVIENTPSGVTTTTERLTPHTKVVESTSTIITSQAEVIAGQSQQNVSTLDRLWSFFTGNTASQNDGSANVSTPTAQAYSQVYISGTNGTTFVTDPTETISALNEWLGFNGIALKSLGDGSFSITQGDVVAIITPKDNKIAVNLSRMELMVNTQAGFQPLSYLPARVTTYLIDSGIISRVSEPIRVVETSSELLLQMKTTSTQYLFAIIPVPIRIEYCMSATTLNPCGKKQGLLSKTLDFLSL